MLLFKKDIYYKTLIKTINLNNTWRAIGTKIITAQSAGQTAVLPAEIIVASAAEIIIISAAKLVVVTAVGAAKIAVAAELVVVTALVVIASIATLVAPVAPLILVATPKSFLYNNK